MAYRQTPGRGPTATFKNVTALLGPTAPGNPGEPGSNYSKKEQRRLRDNTKCTKGVEGTCTNPNAPTGDGDGSSTTSKSRRDPSKQKNYLVEDVVFKTTTKPGVDLEYNLIDGGEKAAKSKDLHTSEVRTSTPLKENAREIERAENLKKVKKKYLNQEGANKYNTSAEKFDMFVEQEEKRKVGSEKTLSRYKKTAGKTHANTKGRDFVKDKFKKSVTTRKGSDTGKVGDSLDPNATKSKGGWTTITGTTKTKSRLLKPGTKTKSFKLEGTQGSGKEVTKKKLERKNKRFIRQVTGSKRNTTGVDKQTQGERTENRIMNQRKAINQGFNQGSVDPIVSTVPSKSSKFWDEKAEAYAAKRKRNLPGKGIIR